MEWIHSVSGGAVTVHGLWPFVCLTFLLGYAWRGSIYWCRRLSKGPKQPGNDIDVYLRPLVDELLLLWKPEGVCVWDEYKQENFDLRALLFVTINDWPALSNLSGQSNKGYQACTHCLDETDSLYLKNSRKVVYMGHRRFLPLKHSWEEKGNISKGNRKLVLSLCSVTESVFSRW